MENSNTKSKKRRQLKNGHFWVIGEKSIEKRRRAVFSEERRSNI